MTTEPETLPVAAEPAEHYVPPPKVAIDLNVPMSVSEFATFLGVNPRWVRDRLRTLPGVIRHNQKMIRIHPKTYLDAAMGGAVVKPRNGAGRKGTQ